MEKPFFSIIIPHINEGYMLNVTLDSIYNYIKYPNFEVIVVDDGSENQEDLNFIKTHFLKDKITLLKTYDKGAELVRNYGSQYAKGNRLVFLDSHMYMVNDAITKIADLIQKRTDIEFLQPTIGNLQKKSENASIYKFKKNLKTTRGKPLKELKSGYLYETPCVIGAATFIKKKLFNKLGGYNPFLRKRGCDFELGMRARLHGHKVYYFKDAKIAHMYKQKFLNTKITSTQTTFNRVLTINTVITNKKRKEKLMQEMHKYGIKKSIESQINIKNNEKIIKRISKQKKQFIHNDDRYFDKFKYYFPEIYKYGKKNYIKEDLNISVPKTQNIGIVMFYTENISDYGNLTKEINQVYAKKHNYNLIVETKPILKDCHAARNKIAIIKKHLKNYDYIFRIDSDAIFIKHERNLESFIYQAQKKDLLICDDIVNGPNYGINTGTMFRKNTERSNETLNDLLSLHSDDKYKNTFPREQKALASFFTENKHNIEKHSAIFPANSFNSNYPALKNHTKDNFILHLMRTDHQTRIKTIKKYHKKLIK